MGISVTKKAGGLKDEDDERKNERGQGLQFGRFAPYIDIGP